MAIFQIDHNLLNGHIPTRLGSLSSVLRYLDLSCNELSGDIPTIFNQLTELSVINLHNNCLNGSLPSDLFNWTAASYMYLSGNRLTGSLPVVALNMVNLHVFDVSFNSLSGTIPDTFGYLHTTALVLAHNCFTGSIPAALTSMTALLHLQLEHNSFSQSIPAALGSMTALTGLSVQFNMLTGEIPPAMGSMSKLAVADLSNLDLSGTVPNSFCNLTRLMNLSMVDSGVVCYPDCLHWSAQVHGAREGCVMNCSAGEVFSPSEYICSNCPIDSYLPLPSNDTSCIPCTGHTTTALHTGSKNCPYFRWTTNLSTIYTVLMCIGAAYLVCFAAAGEKSLAIIANMFLPMMDLGTDVFYLMNEAFYSLLIFQICAFFLLAPCLVFAYELIKDADVPTLRLPFSNYGFSAESPSKAFVLLLQLVLTIMWLVAYIPFIMLWFVVGSFLHNSHTMSVARIRRLWYWVWNGLLTPKPKGRVDVRVLNRALFSGFVLEALPQLLIQIYNSNAIGGFGYVAVFSIVLSALMTMAGVYKFVYWKYYRGVEWQDIPVVAIVPNVSWLQLKSTHEGDIGEEEEYEDAEGHDHESTATDTNSQIDEVLLPYHEYASVGETDKQEGHGKQEDVVDSQADSSSILSEMSLLQTVIWLRAERVPMFHSLRLFALFDQHDGICKFVYFVLLWIACIILQIVTILFIPLWMPLNGCGLRIFSVSDFAQQEQERDKAGDGDGNRKQPWMLSCLLIAYALILGYWSTSPPLVVLIFPDFCVEYNYTNDREILSCNVSRQMMFAIEWGGTILVCLTLTSRLFYDRWYKKFMTVFFAAVVIGPAAFFGFYFNVFDVSFQLLAVAGFLMTLLDIILDSSQQLCCEKKHKRQPITVNSVSCDEVVDVNSDVGMERESHQEPLLKQLPWPKVPPC